jgi:RHS repeat-associated protein
VKAVENGVTTVYIGDYYEWRSDSSTTTQVKYYYAGGMRIAMRTNGVLTWLLGDHFGSTTITATENGAVATQQTYTAWGQTRSGAVGTDRQYTGQIEEAQLGIYFYNARYYDSYLARFLSPDTIVPQPGNPLAWDRYAYVLHNPIKYDDPSGHDVGCDTNYLGSCKTYANNYAYKAIRESSEWQLDLEFVGVWDSSDRQSFITAAQREAKIQFSAFCGRKYFAPGECGFSSPEELYRSTHGTTVLTMSTITQSYYCERNANAGQEGTICYANSRGRIDNILAAHELAHVFNARIGNNGHPTPYVDLATERANNVNFPGYGYDITQGYNRDDALTTGEDFANMYSMYVFDVFPPTAKGGMRRDFMITNMALWVGRALP